MVTLTSPTPTILIFNSPSLTHNLLLFGFSQYQNPFLKFSLENYHFISCIGKENLEFCHFSLSTNHAEFSHVHLWYLVPPNPKRQTNHFSCGIIHWCCFSCSFLCSANAVASYPFSVLPKILCSNFSISN